MKTIQKITKEINQLTLTIEEKFPELYRNLSETPIALNKKEKTISIKELSSYLETLKDLLKEEIELQNKK